MAQDNSIDKIVESYFWAVTKHDFFYKRGKWIAKPLHVSPHFFHEYTCKLGCAGCCSSRFSLDYLPTDPQPEGLKIKLVNINGIEKSINTIMNKNNKSSKHCDNVNPNTGACIIHGKHPFSCDFETLRFVHYPDHSWLGVRPYGRGWNMLRIDNDRGAVCDFPKISTDQARLEGIRKLTRLKQWTDYFNLETHIPDIIEWAEKGISDTTLYLTPGK